MFARISDQDGSTGFNTDLYKLGEWNAINLETGELTPGSGHWTEKLRHVKRVYDAWVAEGKPRDCGQGAGFVTWAWDNVGVGPFDVAQYGHLFPAA
jgi:hypothetical protein